MELRLVEKDDFIWIWQCRNEPTSRANSIHTEEISLEEHITWIDKSLNMAKRRLMVAWNEGQKIAVVRLDLDGNKAMVSINIAKEHRGKGNSLKILSKLESEATKWNKEIRYLLATIKRTNEISIRVFFNAGYKQYEVKDDFMIMRKEIEGE